MRRDAIHQISAIRSLVRYQPQMLFSRNLRGHYKGNPRAQAPSHESRKHAFRSGARHALDEASPSKATRRNISTRCWTYPLDMSYVAYQIGSPEGSKDSRARESVTRG